MLIEKEAAHIERGQGFIRKYVFSLDHKIVGLQYFFTALAMAVFGGLLSMLMRLQLGWPSKTWPMLEKILERTWNLPGPLDIGRAVPLFCRPASICLRPGSHNPGRCRPSLSWRWAEWGRVRPEGGVSELQGTCLH